MQNIFLIWINSSLFWLKVCFVFWSFISCFGSAGLNWSLLYLSWVESKTKNVLLFVSSTIVSISFSSSSFLLCYNLEFCLLYKVFNIVLLLYLTCNKKLFCFVCYHLLFCSSSLLLCSNWNEDNIAVNVLRTHLFDTNIEWGWRDRISWDENRIIISGCFI